MCHILFLLLIAAISAGELSEDCKYVNSTYELTSVDRVKACFDSYQIHQDIIDAIIRNLEIIHDFYPYNDIAMNPPSEPAGYFKKMNFTYELEQLKTLLSQSDRIVSKVFRPTMKLISGFRDSHFGLSINPVIGKYENIFSRVFLRLPFEWTCTVEGNIRKVKITSPNEVFLSQEAIETITAMNKGRWLASTVDGKDAFDFFSNIGGEYNSMKSPRGSLYYSQAYGSKGLSLLVYPRDDVFDTHTIVFSDPDNTTVNFTFGFFNTNARGNSNRDKMPDTKMPASFPFYYTSKKQEEETWEMLKHLKVHSLRDDHYIVTCDKYADMFAAQNEFMNYIEIPSFNYQGELAERFILELLECVAVFDTNSNPIIILFPGNPGGNPALRILSYFLLMPSADFRALHAMRKSEASRHIAVDKKFIVNIGFSSDEQTCDHINDTSDAESFFSMTETDDLGGGFTHERTEKAVEGFKSVLLTFSDYRIWKNVRNPTDIIIATDGYCVSTCAYFVNDAINSGAAIVAGFGLTNPGDDLFAAGQCPSYVIKPEEFFDELEDNSKYGLQFVATVAESYSISDKNNVVPGDYSIIPVDVHTQFYDSYNPQDGQSLQRFWLLSDIARVHEQFKTECNPANKKLIQVSKQCKSNDPFAVLSGYICGSNGEWNVSTCRIARCSEGYVVDFENDKCVPNPCDPRYASPLFSPSLSSSTTQRPLLTVILFVVSTVFRLVN